MVGILDTGELSDGKPYIVMQYVDGVTLRSQIKPEGMPFDRAGEVVKQIGRALGAAHDKGIFHRDLKPENIMLQSFGAGEEQVKIIDFGIAKLKDSIVAPSTMTGATAGTVAYMAPEQLGGRPTSAATDIFAFGAIAYEIVTGRKPFNPETGFELLEMQRQGVRVGPSDLRPAVSLEANEIILRSLSFVPSQRFQAAREFGDSLARALTEDLTLEQSRAPIAVRRAGQAKLDERHTWRRAHRRHRHKFAKCGADRPPARHDAHDIGDHRLIGASERAPRRFLHVDERGAARQGDLRFGSRAHAHQ